MTGNISYLSNFKPFDGGYVSFGQGGCKISGKGTIKTDKLKFKNVYFVKDLKYNLFSMSQICDNKNSVLFTDAECIVLGRNFKLLDDANIFLRTPRQHNMYSIDLNNIVPHKDLTCLVAKASADECILWHRRLGKFEAKGDEGYFIGYSMSSKAFRVFNKRTKRIEENLHVEFLENKAIEKGTKDAANQEVKKDVSSLRYIALPNWAHDALLESSSSKPHDESSTKVLEGSGNPNPTASSSNSPADQMETLESPIPTVTDVSNMETTISASPTPTLRIHKDHPKSQIIGPMDTPIQTRHKSKEVEEQSFIASIYQKTDPALL
nr:ribonuclease H-like domain-containing protein [Tanacetum cinerariifolium]